MANQELPSNLLSAKNLKNIGTMAGLITVVVVSFYLTGLVRNVMQIKKLQEENSKPLKPEDL